MRILYLHQYFTLPTEAGGTRSYEIARRLADWGHDVHMITTDRKSPAQQKRGWWQTQEAGIHIHRLSIPYSNSMSYPARIRAFVVFAWSAAQRAATIKGDVVLATSTPLTIALPGIYAARSHRIPMVFEIRDLWPEVPIAIGALRGSFAITSARWLERFAYRNSAQIIALSPGIKTGIVKSGYPSERVHIIPNGCDLDLFDVTNEAGQMFRRRFHWLQERPLVVYTGTLGKINGVDYLVRLAKVTCQIAPEIRFLVVGEGQEWDKVQTLSMELDVLNRNFFMLKSLPKSQIPAVLSAAEIATSVFINLPEMEANSANKFFDALAAGKPIAINYQGWQAELLRESGAGLILDVRDTHSSAKLLAAKLLDRAWLNQAGQAAKKLAVERFAREKLVRQIETVLFRAVER